MRICLRIAKQSSALGKTNPHRPSPKHCPSVQLVEQPPDPQHSSHSCTHHKKWPIQTMLQWVRDAWENWRTFLALWHTHLNYDLGIWHSGLVCITAYVQQTMNAWTWTRQALLPQPPKNFYKPKNRKFFFKYLSFSSGTSPLFQRSTIPKVCYSESPLCRCTP